MYQSVKLRELNPFITCGICSGYLIDATTITECLHTFCRSCIVKHLQDENFCPSCKIVIHQSYPMNYISADRTMQEIVYKLVPGLQERDDVPSLILNSSQHQRTVCEIVHVGRNASVSYKKRLDALHRVVISLIFDSPFLAGELQRQKEFEVAMFMYRTGEQQNEYNAMNLTKTHADNPSPSSSCTSNDKEENQDYHRGDEQVAICMECYRANGKYSLKPLPRKYLRLSSQATVLHLKKFLAKKLSLDDHKDVDILCNDEILGKDHTLKFICVTRWRFKTKSQVILVPMHRKLTENFLHASIPSEPSLLNIF